MTKPFDKPLDSETSRAFAAFCVYRDLGMERTLDEAYRHDRGQPESNKKATGAWTKWSTNNHWVERAKAYDAYITEKARMAREEQHIQELNEYRAELAKISRLSLATGTLMLQRVYQRVKSLSERDIENLDIKQLAPLARAGNDSIEKAVDGWGMALGVDELMDMLEGDE